MHAEVEPEAEAVTPSPSRKKRRVVTLEEIEELKAAERQGQAGQ
ncbi:hypothetical protein ACH5AU_31340 [Streptomyces albidoflavus]